MGFNISVRLSSLIFMFEFYHLGEVKNPTTKSFSLRLYVVISILPSFSSFQSPPIYSSSFSYLWFHFFIFAYVYIIPNITCLVCTGLKETDEDNSCGTGLFSQHLRRQWGGELQVQMQLRLQHEFYAIFVCRPFLKIKKKKTNK